MKEAMLKYKETWNFRGLTHGFVYRENEKVIGNWTMLFIKWKKDRRKAIYIWLEWIEAVEENVVMNELKYDG